MSFLFMSDILEWLEKGDVIRRICSVLLKIMAVLMFFGALYGFIRNWSYIEGFGSFLGILWLQIVFVVATYMVLHTVWYRSNSISEIECGRYVVLPIMSKLSRMIGEIGAVISAAVGIAGSVFILFARIPPGLRYSLPQALQSKTGIGFLVVGFVAAFLTLVFGYLYAEILIVIVDIARNTAEDRSA